MIRAGREWGDPWDSSGPVATFRMAAAALQEVGDRERFEVAFRREFRLQAGTTGRLAPLPLDDPALIDVDVDLIELPPDSVETSRAPGRLEVRVPATDRPASVAVEVVIRFSHGRPLAAWIAMPSSPGTRPARNISFTPNPNEGLIRSPTRSGRSAESLAPRSPRPWDALAAFWDFFFRGCRADASTTTSSIRTIPWGRSRGGGGSTALPARRSSAGLCRARGIPARVVNGFTLYE